MAVSKWSSSKPLIQPVSDHSRAGVSAGLPTVRLDQRPIPADRQECRAFSVVQDEALRLPAWLDHHRSLGVDRFFVIDNGSSDATRDILLAQPDCHVFSNTGSFSAARLGMNWINQAIERYGQGHWCLRVDADECLVYPDHERIRLPEFCRYLDQTGALGLYTFMLDMYSQQPISQAHYDAGTPFLDVCPYFDKDYTFRRRLAAFPVVEPIGGPRLRLFYPHFNNASLLRWTLTIKYAGDAVQLPHSNRAIQD